jgi:hypothetical protein
MNIREFKVPGVKDITSTFLKDGVHIASRPGLFCSIALFQVGDWYVEIFYNKKTNEVGRVKTFRDMELLDPYLKQINISSLLKN